MEILMSLGRHQSQSLDAVFNGEIFSDFDISLRTNAIRPLSEESNKKKAKYIKSDRTMRGTINGGGPEMQFKTFSGNIFIRKLSK
jgi:hypothetical protein